MDNKEGFLRSERSLIQTIGRAARNLNGKAILYADRMTDSMHRAILRKLDAVAPEQVAFNEEHGITPRGVSKAVRELIDGVVSSDPTASLREDVPEALIRDEKAAAREIKRLEKEMMDHARNLEFEQAAAARDKLQRLKTKLLMA